MTEEQKEKKSRERLLEELCQLTGEEKAEVAQQVKEEKAQEVREH